MINRHERLAAHRVGVRRELFMFYGAAALALIVVSFGAVVASRSVARAQALTDAERMTTRLADLVVGPLLVDALNGDAAHYAELTHAVENRMGDGYLSQVTVWDVTGEVLFADDPKEIGKQVDPPDEVIDAISHGVVSSDFESKPEATDLTPAELQPGFVEVYVPFEVAGQPTLAFEAYYDYARVDEIANSLLWQLIPLVLVPLIALVAIQVPIAASMARRVRRHEAERSNLLERSLSVSERERVRVAADLHDGPIQDLAGVGYALGAMAGSVPEHQQPLMRTVQETVHRSIDSLRQLMVDLYPPDLSVSQLPTTLSNLAAPLVEQGIEVELNVGRLPTMNIDIVTALYRVANEALANVAEHSKASKVCISLQTSGGPDSDRGGKVRLQITDNGIGFDPSKLDRRSEGHLGLRLLRSRVEDLGGTFTFTTGSGGGAAVGAELPLEGTQSGAALLTGRGNAVGRGQRGAWWPRLT